MILNFQPMKNIITILAILSLSSCGFHTPYKASAVNFNITGNNDFNKVISKRLDTNLAKKLTLKIKDITTTKINQNFNAGNIANYNFELGVVFEVYKNNKMIYNNTLFASRYLKNSTNSSNAHQEQKAYEYMQNELVDKIIRKMSKL
jgi:outer membrane lipopolysaccharide assembly protein LptE/RlpB